MTILKWKSAIEINVNGSNVIKKKTDTTYVKPHMQRLAGCLAWLCVIVWNRIFYDVLMFVWMFDSNSGGGDDDNDNYNDNDNDNDIDSVCIGSFVSVFQ